MEIKRISSGLSVHGSGYAILTTFPAINASWAWTDDVNARIMWTGIWLRVL